MALNRNLYPTKGSNIVGHGRMMQRWLVSSTDATKVVTATDEFGLANNPTAGRGLNITDFSTGRFTVSLDAGNAVADFLKADANVIAYGQTSAYIAVPEAITTSSVTFQLWKNTATGPVIAKSNPPLSVLGSVSTGFAIGTSPYVALQGTSATTFASVPVTVVASGGTPILGLTMTLVTSATSSVTTGSFVAGRSYTITNVGDTDFTLIGAARNAIGVQFTATGVGGGTTGTANTATIASASFDQSSATVASILAVGAPGTVTTYTVSLPANLNSTTATCNAATSFGTLSVTQASPVYVSVDLQFTMSAVVA